MDLQTAVAELGSPGGRLPGEALQWSLDHWDEAAPRFLQIFDAYLAGEDTSDAKATVLFFALHLLAERGENAAFGRLCRLLHDNAATEDVLGDAITETLQQLLISLYDGDREALAKLIEAPEVDGWVRHAAFQAWAGLTFARDIPLDETKRYLLRLYDTLQPQQENQVWAGFAEAIALLGLRSHRPLVQKLERRGLLDPTYMDLDDFDGLLARGSLAEPGLLFAEERVQPFADTIATLARWDSFSGKGSSPDVDFDADLDDLDLFEIQEPVVNPFRHVGRNDPCPCGSGKKFKKCCLAHQS